MAAADSRGGDEIRAKGERALVARLRRRLPDAAGGAAGFGDDMAGVPGEPRLLWTTDLLSDGVDFRSGVHAWRSIGRKSMDVNLSDCAAMGAKPVAALCAVCLSDALRMEDALELMDGAAERGEEFDCPIVGGDTNSWRGGTVIAISLAARLEAGWAAIGRSGAKAGDVIWVSGPLGGSILGRHLRIEPRIDLALRVRERISPHAMIDISDGLAIDLDRILEASDRGATLFEGELLEAVHEDAVRLGQQDGRPAIEHALYDGEDYELIVVGDAAAAGAARELGLRAIGRIEAQGGMEMESESGERKPITIRGWEHFR